MNGRKHEHIVTFDALEHGQLPIEKATHNFTQIRTVTAAASQKQRVIITVYELQVGNKNKIVALCLA